MRLPSKFHKYSYLIKPTACLIGCLFCGYLIWESYTIIMAVRSFAPDPLEIAKIGRVSEIDSTRLKEVKEKQESNKNRRSIPLKYKFFR